MSQREGRKILVEKDGEFFGRYPSVRLASQGTGLCRNTVMRYLSRGDSYQGFRFIDDGASRYPSYRVKPLMWEYQNHEFVAECSNMLFFARLNEHARMDVGIEIYSHRIPLTESINLDEAIDFCTKHYKEFVDGLLPHLYFEERSSIQ